MKKVVLGSLMLLSGIIGMVGTMIVVAITLDWPRDAIDQMFEQQTMPFFFVLFIALALAGLVIGVIGIFTKDNK